MAMQVGDPQGDDDINATINTTPLVDVMLVMLIIFLITIPVIVKTAPVVLPKANNIVTQTKPENVVLAVDKNGFVYWNNIQLHDYTDLLNRLKTEAVKVPQP